MPSRYQRLYIKAYSLCVEYDCREIINDLPYLSHSELIGVIKRLSKLGGRNGL